VANERCLLLMQLRYNHALQEKWGTASHFLHFLLRVRPTTPANAP